MIALTGGIASGKSTIAARLAELGAHIIDADLLSREAVEPGTAALEQIKSIFGDAVIAGDGSLDRQGLAAVVFNDAEALQTLNGIVHPAVRGLFEERLGEIAERDPQSIVIYDVPLLVESSAAGEWSHVIVASSPEEIRIERLIQLRGLSEQEAKARVQNQAHESERLKVADTVIDTSGTIASTLKQVDEFWALITSDAELTEEPI